MKSSGSVTGCRKSPRAICDGDVPSFAKIATVPLVTASRDVGPAAITGFGGMTPSKSIPEKSLTRSSGGGDTSAAARHNGAGEGTAVVAPDLPALMSKGSKRDMKRSPACDRVGVAENG